MQANQQTIKNIYTFTGKGLHTGSYVTMRLVPAPENHGIKFRRTDIEGQPTIEASADNVKFTDRGTVLEASGAKISTVEHVMSALYALGADNVLIEIDGEEVPILDGSAGQIVDAIEKAGIFEPSFACSIRSPISGSFWRRTDCFIPLSSSVFAGAKSPNKLFS